MIVVMKLALAGGATVVSMPRFDMEEFLGLVQQYKATTLPLVPPVVLGLAKSPLVDQFDLSSVRTIFCGAAPLGRELSIETSERIGCPIMQGYGMTEASPVTHLSSMDPEKSRPGAIGKVIPDTEVRVIDVESGQDCAQGNDGELWIRGPQIMRGYLNQPEETADCIDSEGWYHTGDVGYVDEDGFFFIVDRVKELIKYKAMQVSPAELEALLVTHPEILDTAVIPCPDEEAGEIPKAIVILKDPAAASDELAEKIMAFVADNVAPHKRVRLLDFAEQIPKSASGKILRRVLVDAERSRHT
jgi:acyl-CoA synthetase (AMP-forming)/AMP-acid ligase II